MKREWNKYTVGSGRLSHNSLSRAKKTQGEENMTTVLSYLALDTWNVMVFILWCSAGAKNRVFLHKNVLSLALSTITRHGTKRLWPIIIPRTADE